MEQYSYDINFFSSIEIYLLFEPSMQTELYPSISVSFNQNGECSLSEILSFFQNSKIVNPQNPIYYWDAQMNCYIYCNNFYNDMNGWIPNHSVFTQNDKCFVYLKCKSSNNKSEVSQNSLANIDASCTQGVTESNLSFNFEEESLIVKSPEGSDGESYASDGVNKGGKRHGERKIFQVLELIKQWRSYFEGIQDPITNQVIKLSLHQAAEKVGVLKKSLDDYHLFIRHGERLGFNFKENMFKGFGVLRQYVKKNKSKYCKST